MTLTLFKVNAQSEPMYSQYMLNGLLINPAYAGTHKVMDIALLHRNQWSGLRGAPKTSTLSIHTVINNSNSGIGLNIVTDKIGITSQTLSNFNYAYKIPFQNGSLSLGLMAQVNFIQFDYQNLNVDDDGDPFFSQNQNKTDISFGTGVFYHTDKFYLGISMPHLQRSSVFRKHWFLHAGKVIDLTYDVKLKPSILVKYVDGAPLELDLNATAYWKDKFWFGASLRSFDGIYALLGMQFTKRLSLGYAFDLALTEINNYANGSHELVLRYRFVSNQSKIITPRYF